MSRSLQGKAIPLFKPLIEREEFEAARAALELGWLGMGSYVAAFERELAAFIGAGQREVVALSTGHAALHLALLLAGVERGHEVITPSFNNAADFQAILAAGAEPVFCDIRDDTLCVDLAKAESLVTSRTRAIIVTDYACHLCNHDDVASLARRRGLRVVHDAAHSFGSRYQGRMVGGFGDITIFSYDPIKTITCIDGGAIILDSASDAKKAMSMRLLGMSQPTELLYGNSRARSYDIDTPGFRYHMANLHAAIGLAQLARFEEIAESRRRACRRYNDRLAQLADVRVPRSDLAEIAPFMYWVRVPKECRDRLRTHLEKRGIETGIHWQPGHSFTLLRSFRHDDLSVTDRVWGEIISLPLHSRMPLDLVDRVADEILEFFNT